MPSPSSNSSASDTVAEMPASAAIDDGIDRTAAADYDEHISPPSMPKTHETPQHIRTSTSRHISTSAHSTKFASFVVAICVLSNFCVEVGDFLMRAPFIRILEAILCRQYWQEHDPGRFPAGEIDEKWCKVASVQADLSMLKGWDLLFSCLPTILLTIPMGIVADRYGRKMLLFVALAGLALATAWMQIVGKF
jgi:hypothetical protein